MSVWQCSSGASSLSGSEGELISVSISVDPRELEALLEALAQADFPINPQIYHSAGQPAAGRTIVEFPAYSGGLPQVRAALADSGFNTIGLQIKAMLEEIQSY